MDTHPDGFPVFKVIVRASHGWMPLHLRSLWEYRDLLCFLVWRDIKVRYKQTVLGILWAALQPLLMMVVLFIFFGRLAKVPSDGLPYPVFVFGGLLAWHLFAFALSESSHSLVTSERLITKVYFPRLIIPLAAAVVGLVDFFFSLLVFLAILFAFGINLSANFWAFPFFVLFALAAALSVGLWLAALNVKYRDVRYTIPFMIQLWFFTSPVVYPTSLVPERWRLLYSFNPMVGIIEGMRWSLLGRPEAPGPELALSIVMMGALLLSGLYYFRRVEQSFADVI